MEAGGGCGEQAAGQKGRVLAPSSSSSTQRAHLRQVLHVLRLDVHNVEGQVLPAGQQ